ncbi:MAG: peptide MFS transporter [Steroidobacteraceae bacterium]|nr:peptide MFS transporter [Steroidobacteraceae bacterium]MCC7198287.1 peptide MFS transporter [Gammaproteobacteria bacterium]
MSFFGHPRALSTLFFTEMWERFTFYGMRALLVLFLVDSVQSGGFGLDDKTATAIYGLYTAATFMAALPGGWIADRLVGAQRAVVAGGMLMTLGNALLVIPGPPALFFAGLITIILGVGLLKPNVSTLVAQLYPEGGARRDAGFTIFYMGINLGAFIGPLIAGFLAEQYGWRWGFLAAAVAIPVGTLQFWLSRERLAGAGAAPIRSDGGSGLAGDWRKLGIGLAVVLLGLGLCLTGVIPVDPASLAKRAAWVLVSMAAGYFIYLFFFAGLEPVERRRVVVLLSMFVACALFWAGYEQGGSSLNLFAKRFVDRTIGGFEIPAGWLQSVPPLFVIVFAPLFSMLWVALARRMLDPTVPVKFGLALILMGCGFLFMVHAASIVAAGFESPVHWLVLTYMIHVFGELCLSPVGLSTVTKLAPARFVGQMMGVWFLASSLGKLLAGLIAGTFDAGDVAAMPARFMGITWYGVIVGVILLLLAKPLTRLMGGVR